MEIHNLPDMRAHAVSTLTQTKKKHQHTINMHALSLRYRLRNTEMASNNLCELSRNNLKYYCYRTLIEHNTVTFLFIKKT